MISVTPTNIPEVLVVNGKVYPDERGFFIETYKKSEFLDALKVDFVQDNFSFSKKNVLRGLHFQVGDSAQAKLVRVLRGKIWDVAVDLRPTSPTFKHWVGVELSAESGQALFVPDFCAHGFVVLSEEAEVLYKVSKEYNPEAERGIVWNDSELNIAWPVQNPIVSEKDSKYPPVS